MAGRLSPNISLPDGMFVVDVPLKKMGFYHIQGGKYLAFDVCELIPCATHRVQTHGTRYVFFQKIERWTAAADALGYDKQEALKNEAMVGAIAQQTSGLKALISSPTRAELIKLLEEEKEKEGDRTSFINKLNNGGLQEAQNLQLAPGTSLDWYNKLRGLIKLNKMINYLYNKYINTTVPANHSLIPDSHITPSKVGLPLYIKEAMAAAAAAERAARQADGDVPTSSEGKNDYLHHAANKLKTAWQKRKKHSGAEGKKHVTHRKKKGKKRKSRKPKSRVKGKKSQKKSRKNTRKRH